MSGKYLLVEVISDSIPAIEGLKDGVVVKYFDNLVDIQSYICNELVYDELDIEDFKNPPYSGVEERLEEHGSSYYIFEGEKEIISLIIGDLKDGDWEKFLDICLPIKESKILEYKQFNESKKDKVIDDFKKRHLDKYDYSKVEYTNNRTNVEIICPKHGTFFQNPYSHRMGSSCPKCVNKNKVDNNSFINSARMIHGDKYDYSMVNYINNKSKVDIICELHGMFSQTPSVHILKKSGCPKCYGGNKSNSDFIEIAKSLHSNKYDYSNVNYKTAHDKVDIVCPKHGHFNMSYNSHITKGYGCPFCSETSGESYVRKILIDNNINFEYQKKFKDCMYIRNLTFDFFLPDRNIIIEYDGRQHFMPIWGGEYEFSIIRKRDEIKNKYCVDNNIKIIRIRYDENIDDKLNELI